MAEQPKVSSRRVMLSMVLAVAEMGTSRLAENSHPGSGLVGLITQRRSGGSSMPPLLNVWVQGYVVEVDYSPQLGGSFTLDDGTARVTVVPNDAELRCIRSIQTSSTQGDAVAVSGDIVPQLSSFDPAAQTSCDSFLRFPHVPIPTGSAQTRDVPSSPMSSGLPSVGSYVLVLGTVVTLAEPNTQPLVVVSTKIVAHMVRGLVERNEARSTAASSQMASRLETEWTDQVLCAFQ